MKSEREINVWKPMIMFVYIFDTRTAQHFLFTTSKPIEFHDKDVGVRYKVPEDHEIIIPYPISFSHLNTLYTWT
jgi:hypothetical protein